MIGRLQSQASYHRCSADHYRPMERYGRYFDICKPIALRGFAAVRKGETIAKICRFTARIAALPNGFYRYHMATVLHLDKIDDKFIEDK